VRLPVEIKKKSGEGQSYSLDILSPEAYRSIPGDKKKEKSAVLVEASRKETRRMRLMIKSQKVKEQASKARKNTIERKYWEMGRSQERN